MEIKAGATVDVSPKGGQIAVFSLLAFAACSFGASVWLYTEQKPFALPLIGAGVFLAIGSIFWTMSHRNEALKHSHPFTMNLGEGENALAISADARSMPALNYIKEVLDHYSSIFHRSPLPQASGVIGPDGQPILGTEAEAQLITDQANLVAQQQCDALLGRVIFHEAVAATDGSPVVDQLTP